jgi:high-affinity Fe2+/Pb2+ permease
VGTLVPTGFHMDELRKYLAKRLFIVIACGVCVAVVLTLTFVVGSHSNSRLIVTLIILCCIMAIATIVILKGASKLHLKLRDSAGESYEEATRVQNQSRIRRIKIYIVLINLFLIYGLWATRGNPLMPRVIGAVISLYITARLISIVQRLRRIGK